MKKKLGQHFLNSNKIAQRIVDKAKITQNDIVYEIGTGYGILTVPLCKHAKKVISIDADHELYENACANLEIKNLVLLFGDGFKEDIKFDIFVSNLPYSKSRLAIEWLAKTEFSHGVIMVQKEFASKLLGDTSRRAITVIANHTLDITKISNISKENFNPPPMVDSVLLKIRKKNSIDKRLIQTINRIFSYRRKTISNILKQFGINSDMNKRLDDLTNEEIVNIAKDIIR